MKSAPVSRQGQDTRAATAGFERLLVDHLDVVRQAVQFVARRYCLSDDDRDELFAAIQLKLIDRDYEVLRKFQHTSTLRTYLTSVVLRHFLDQRNAKWGKWRPSRIARKLGGVALRLDELLSRDGLSVGEASELLRINHGLTVSDREIADLVRQLPERTSRRFVGEEALEDVAASSASPAAALDRAQSARDATRIEDHLLAALRKRSPEDLLILQYHFDGGLKTVTIARLIGMEPKPLYRRLEKLIHDLRRDLEASGVSRAALDGVRDGLVELRPILRLAAAGERPSGPSHG